MRINKFIALNSKFSRRKADDLIIQGKVFINGIRTTKLGLDINPEKDKVQVQNETITQKTKIFYIALNKPAGYITTREDEKNRKTVLDLLPKIKNLKPVGRLDKDTEGLLLLSTDGDFINRYTHPKFECKKIYFAIIEGKLTEPEKQKLENGVIIDGKKTSKAKIQIKHISNQETELTIEIHEGRNRQVRKMFAVIVHFVKYLQRIQIGNIKLGNLKKGQYRNLTLDEQKC